MECEKCGLNGEPLSAKHGFPARLVAPGYYGHNSVKWVCRLEAAAHRARGYFTENLYTDPGRDGAPAVPVWEIEPESLIVSPTDGSLRTGPAITVWGWAWSATAVERVEISTAGGQSWVLAELEGRRDRSWQRFSYQRVPTRDGPHAIKARARDRSGRMQPESGRRNAVHGIGVTVQSGRPSAAI